MGKVEMMPTGYGRIPIGIPPISYESAEYYARRAIEDYTGNELPRQVKEAISGVPWDMRKVAALAFKAGYEKARDRASNP